MRHPRYEHMQPGLAQRPGFAAAAVPPAAIGRSR
jgi:hypothetical protein